ncbi:HAD family hydrolase [Corynebacterium sp. TAE3-ERU16]|uniref:HAD family hydrolase n=1 Tax=Corynebacterium sp. TAE3-ERU16 TaxID=2849493 RepID=UPI001C477B3C|nr:HAD family hydrolase [Corynebacterium sp. TAE3-ERU16]
MDYKAIIFDLDGTLIDHTGAARAASRTWARELGLRGDQTDRWFEIERRWFEAYEQGTVSHLEQRRGRTREFTGDHTLTDSACDELFGRFLSLYRDAWTAFPDAEPALRRALETGARVAVLTNSVAEIQSEKLRRTGLDLPGVRLLASGDLGVAKPRPECYRKALELLGVAPGEAVMIGDSYANDVAGPRRAGMAAVWLNRDDLPAVNGDPGVAGLAGFPPGGMTPEINHTYVGRSSTTRPGCTTGRN